MSKSYAELVAEAEGAVSGVKDAELKRVAFEKILDDLLSDPKEKTNSGIDAAAHPPRRRKKSTPGATRVSPRGGPMAYVAEMIDDGFFKKVKTMGEVKAELENRGHHIPFTSLSGPLQKLCQSKKLRRQKMDRGGKKAFVYSNW